MSRAAKKKSRGNDGIRADFSEMGPWDDTVRVLYRIDGMGSASMAPRAEAGRKNPARKKARESAVSVDEKLRRHLRALAMETPEEYRAWCRAQGFADSLVKDWERRREEIAHCEKLLKAAVSAGGLASHVEAMGFATLSEYEAWCECPASAASAAHPSKRRGSDAGRGSKSPRSERRALFPGPAG